MSEAKKKVALWEHRGVQTKTVALKKELERVPALVQSRGRCSEKHGLLGCSLRTGSRWPFRCCVSYSDETDQEEWPRQRA